MKTKSVPALIMLTAGLIDCIASSYCHYTLWHFTWQLLVVLMIFYVLGCIVQLILDKNFPEMEEENEEQAAKNEDGEERQDTEGEQSGSREHSGEMDDGDENK